MSKNTAASVGPLLMMGTGLACLLAMTHNPSRKLSGERPNQPVRDWLRSHYDSVVTGVMTYSFYVIAAFMAGAEFPKFLRDHLFDGLAPAALVAILVDAYPHAAPSTAFGKIRRPVTMILIVFLIPGAAIFALIGVAAVFSSGANDYGDPIIAAALFGGFILPLAYVTQD